LVLGILEMALEVVVEVMVVQVPVILLVEVSLEREQQARKLEKFERFVEEEVPFE